MICSPTVAAACAALAAGSAFAAAPVGAPTAHPETVEVGSREGQRRVLHTANFAGCRWGAPLEVQLEGRAAGEALRGGFPAEFVTMESNGSSSNRIDLVVVGDGYTAGELSLFADHADGAVEELFETPPFDAYRPLFNIHRVEVISNESGVDNDPVEGIERDTALDMAFFCGGTERALCVNVGVALAYASNAPDADQVFAVANSTKYGGVGYPASDLGTLSGGNGQAAQIAIHELGHAMGNLADEYDYGGPTEYQGGEPSARNASTLEASQMASSGAKWADWLGFDEAMYDGLVSTFEGAVYSEVGVYRPTNNSMMRSLGRPFNTPSAEGLIIEMWKIVSPLDGRTPGSTAARDAVLEVVPTLPSLEVRWFVDGEPIGGATGPTLDLSSVGLLVGEREVEARVRDATALVRDEGARAAHMTETARWRVTASADLNGDGVVGSADLAILLAAWGTDGPANLDGSGVVGAGDLGVLIGAWG